MNDAAHGATQRARELELLIEALQARASRHESIGRANQRNAGPHDRTAAEMYKLKGRLRMCLTQREEPEE